MLSYKKFFLVILTIGVIVLFVSCGKGSDCNISVESCEFSLQALKDEVAYNGNIIKNENIAKQYANLIFKDTLEKNLNDYKVTTISLDSNNGVWVVNYGVSEETLGGDISIAFSEKNGEVLKVWFGE